jgi:hypothetical protein
MSEIEQSNEKSSILTICQCGNADFDILDEGFNFNDNVGVFHYSLKCNICGNINHAVGTIVGNLQPEWTKGTIKGKEAKTVAYSCLSCQANKFTVLNCDSSNFTTDLNIFALQGLCCKPQDPFILAVISSPDKGKVNQYIESEMERFNEEVHND